MYTDKYGRAWEGPYQFSASVISANAPKDTGLYQILSPAGQVVYIGVATGDTIAGRLGKHVRGSGNSILAQFGNPDYFTFVYYRCDGQTAKQIESHVIANEKPPFNLKNEYKNFIPSIYIH